MDCTIRVAKTKALISFAVTAKLISVFVFTHAKKPVFSQRGLFSSYRRRDFNARSMNCVKRNPVFGISNQVRHKTAFTATEKWLEVSDLRTK